MGKEYEIVNYTVTSLKDESIDMFLDSADTILTKIKRNDLKSPIFYCIREIANNAERANIKRLFFKDNQLDINDPFDYHKGMLLFSESFQKNLETYREKLQQAKFYIHFKMKLSSSHIKIKVINNSLPTKSEYARITARVERAKSINDISEAFLLFNDLSESGGLGIITICLMLRNMGIHEEGFTFQINSDTQESTALVQVPLTAMNVVQLNYISHEISNEIQSIPKIPDHIRLIENMLNDPDVDFDEVSKVVYRDPGLAVDLLKMMNSASYMLPERVSSVVEAVRYIGVKGLKLMIIAYGTEKIIKGKYTHVTRLLDHCHRCAVYGFLLARHYGKQEILETVYLSSLLHDLGKIVLHIIHPDTIERIRRYCDQNGVRGEVMETLAIGVNHARVGALIAKHWELPENIIEGIEYHHEPLLASQSNRDLIHIVYLADILANLDDAHTPVDYKFVEGDVLSRFDIIDKDYFIQLFYKLQSEYEQYVNR